MYCNISIYLSTQIYIYIYVIIGGGGGGVWNAIRYQILDTLKIKYQISDPQISAIMCSQKIRYLAKKSDVRSHPTK